MAATREQIMSALFARMSALPIAANTYSRRLVQYPMVPPEFQPALYQIEFDEDTIRRGVGLPPKRVLLPQLWFYAKSGNADETAQAPIVNDSNMQMYTDAGTPMAGETAFPASPGATAINNFMDQVEQALAPDDLLRNVCTLGGLVYYARLDGHHVKTPGDWGSQAMAIVKLRIVIP